MVDIRHFFKNHYTNSRSLITVINEYKNPSINKLDYAVNDAEEIRNILINNFAFPADVFL
jgi:hypothetical protein